MSSDVNLGRRRLWLAATSAVGAVGAAGLAVPFVASWNPSAKAKTAGAPATADISKLEPGQRMVVEWRGKPVWILKRTTDAMTVVNSMTSSGELLDPESLDSVQPEYAKNEYRSRQDEDVVVLVGLCTHLGCSPLYRPTEGDPELGASWKGGFYCPCHGSKFDLAGRVFKGVPAPVNLEVPPYYYVTDTVIKIGESGEADT